MPPVLPRRRRLLYGTVYFLCIYAILLGVTWWYAWRPIPPASGSLHAPIHAAATITRDTLGVPHIRAGSVEDALFLQGFATAQDRMWQMDAIRRHAAGELSAILGPATLELDRAARQLNLRGIAALQEQHLNPDDRAAFAAYARGVNHYLHTVQQLPVEFTLLRYSPRDWTITDSVMIGLVMFRDLTTTWDDDLDKATLLKAGDAAKVAQLFPLHTGQDMQPGSNAWVISGRHTASGKPILANDPHLRWGLPSTWHMVSLEAPGLHVSGVALPGVPAVIIGHNDRIAWGVTNLGFDVQDIYPAGPHAAVRTEQIAVKGKPSESVRVSADATRPYLNGYLLRWVAAEPGMFQFPLLEIDRAQNWQQFTTALSRFTGPAQNFVYADVDGNIGYHATGKLPIRRGFNGDVPVAGEPQWDGYIPFDQLPTFYNPPSGIIATANQNPFPQDYPYIANGKYSPPWRARQIRARLAARNGWRPADMLSVQTDVYDAFLVELAHDVTGAFDRKHPSDPALAQAADLLRRWNGQADKDLAAPYLLRLLYENLRTRFAERAAPKQGRLYEDQVASSVIAALLQSKPRDWFPDYDQLLLDSLGYAIKTGEQAQGRDLSSWRYGKFLDITVPHPIFSHIPLLNYLFDINPTPMSGSSFTVKQTSLRIGPSMRFVADLSDWDRSLLGITIGESGHVLSPHYKDQWPFYYAGQPVPMPFRQIPSEGVVTIEP